MNKKFLITAMCLVSSCWASEDSLSRKDSRLGGASIPVINSPVVKRAAPRINTFGLDGIAAFLKQDLQRQKDISELREEVNKLRKELKDKGVLIEEKENSIKELQKKSDGLEAEKVRLNEQLSDIEGEKDRALADIESKIKEIETLQGEKKEADEEHARKLEELKNKSQRVEEEFNRQKDELQKNLKDVTAQKDDSDKLLVQVRKEKEDIERRVEELNNKIDSITSENAELAGEVNVTKLKDTLRKECQLLATAYYTGEENLAHHIYTKKLQTNGTALDGTFVNNVLLLIYPSLGQNLEKDKADFLNLIDEKIERATGELKKCCDKIQDVKEIMKGGAFEAIKSDRLKSVQSAFNFQAEEVLKSLIEATLTTMSMALDNSIEWDWKKLVPDYERYTAHRPVSAAPAPKKSQKSKLKEELDDFNLDSSSDSE